jgi:hypothetical protein
MLLKNLTKQVYLSYTRRESGLAAAVAQVLQAEDCLVWYDRQSIDPGSKLEVELLRALEDSDSMIALLSPHAYSSSWVREELGYALFEERFKNRLLPVLIGDASLEGFSRLPWILRQMKFLGIDPRDSEVSNAEAIVRAFRDLILSSERRP